MHHVGRILFQNYHAVFLVAAVTNYYVTSCLRQFNSHFFLRFLDYPAPPKGLCS